MNAATTSPILGPDGKPMVRTLDPCPRCDGGAKERSIISGFGGHWKRICVCGHVFESGLGLPPVE